jgi:general secretion pathway protein M
VNWFREHPRYSVLLGLTLLPPLWFVVWLAGTLLDMRAGYSDEIERLEPRIARMQGLMSHAAELEQAAAEGGSDVLELVYPAKQDSGAVSAALQKNLREMVASAGLAITNSQILPVREGEAFDQIAVRLTLSGDMAALDLALAEIAAYEPLLLVEDLDVWPGRDRSEGQQIGATLQVLALRARS